MIQNARRSVFRRLRQCQNRHIDVIESKINIRSKIKAKNTKFHKIKSEQYQNNKNSKTEPLSENSMKILETIILSKISKEENIEKLNLSTEIQGLVKLDQNQRKILKDTMSRKVSVIIGPPGTGKTAILAAIV